ncbi:MAG TPA: penicillin-insensitive murein endopeptidase [Polyangia bacterium]|nr:penicillin-insensitive murein endopeptidase [Polyangia bacterium]
MSAAHLSAPRAAATPDGGVIDASDQTAATGKSARAAAETWHRQRVPAPGPARSIGGYSAGCLQGAVALAPRGTGYRLLRPERHRSFGHPAIIAFIQRLVAAARRQRLGPVLVGDIAQARGGPTPTGHRSHQSGLDVDLAYAPPGPAASDAHLTPAQREAIVGEPVVDLRTHRMTAAWTPRVRSLIEAAARDAAVDRLFVNPAIKRQLCAELPRDTPWLGRVRPWWGHHDHFHVRLSCPTDSPDCQSQEPLAPGDGCTALDWWFSPNAQATQTKRREEPEPAPRLPPAACEALIAE